MKIHYFKRRLTLTLSLSVTAITLAAVVLNSCTKDKNVPGTGTNGTAINHASVSQPANALTQVLTVANLRVLSNGVNQVMFNENAQVLNVYDNAVFARLQAAFTAHSKVKVTFSPWQAQVINVTEPTSQEITKAAHGAAANTAGTVLTAAQLKSMNDNDINNSAKLGILDNQNAATSKQSLSSVIPSISEAEAIFNYIARQCCKLSGPYDVDYCISFQYCEDGCYARAQKMGYIFNTTYHYSLHKIFSFANQGNDELSVQAEKWGGCCINWWYHVAPLLNVQTTTGIKAYVFDPAMFDQPVLLSVWLHAQENPACSGSYNPHVSMINVQPQASYSPSDYTGYNFDTDPYYASTDYTLSSYASLSTCP